MAQVQEVRGVHTSVSTSNGTTKVTYRGTDVVTFDSSRIILDTGGWHTATTKTRMTQAANQFGLRYSVYQRDHAWWLRTDAGVYRFDADAMVMDRDPLTGDTGPAKPYR